MKLSKQEKENLSANLYDAINNTLKVNEVRIELGEKEDYNGTLNVLKITFKHSSRTTPFTFNYDFFTKSYWENERSIKHYIVKQIFDLIYYS